MARRNSAVNYRNIFRRLVENAFDFLNYSIEEIEKRPKYSLIHFSAAVELLLKARLASEHWSLVVTQKQEADWQRFVNGDFRSVSLEEAAKKIDKIIRDGLTDRELRSFKDVAKHRNEVVHFFHKVNYEKNRAESVRKIVKQQLRAWYFLHRLLREKWKEFFEEWDEEILNIDKKLRQHKVFLQVIFDEKKELIQMRENMGALFTSCSSCGFQAQEHIHKTDTPYTSECLVCGVIDFCLKINCFDCQSEVIFVNEGFSMCKFCQRHHNPDDVVDHLLRHRPIDAAEVHMAIRDGDDSWDLGNCSSCGSYHTVVRIGEDHVCANCLGRFDFMSRCEWCGEFNTGDMEHSYVTGCNVCDGLMEYDNS